MVVIPVEEFKSAPDSWPLEQTEKLSPFTKLQKGKLGHLSLKCKICFFKIPNIRLVSRSINFPHKHILSKFHSEVGLCLIIRKKENYVTHIE